MKWLLSWSCDVLLCEVGLPGFVASPVVSDALSNVARLPTDCLKRAGEDSGDCLKIARGNRPRIGGKAGEELVESSQGLATGNSMRYQFDQFELDADRYELRRSGVAQHVEPLSVRSHGVFRRQRGTHRRAGRNRRAGVAGQGGLRRHDFHLHQVRAPGAWGQWRTPRAISARFGGAASSSRERSLPRATGSREPGCARPVRDSCSPDPQRGCASLGRRPCRRRRSAGPPPALSSRQHGRFLR